MILDDVTLRLLNPDKDTSTITEYQPPVLDRDILPDDDVVVPRVRKLDLSKSIQEVIVY